MLLWIGFAVLTAAVVAALMQPLRRGETAPLAPAEADLAVYRSQLSEIETERTRGLITEAEVESARAEVARRLIRRTGSGGAKSGSSASGGEAQQRRAHAVYLAVASLVPLLSVALYLTLGAPGLPARPFAVRQDVPVEQASVAALVARIETRLREAPEEGQGWDVIAPVYMHLGRYADAAHAYREASRLLGETPKRLLGFGEATLYAGNGVVSEDVRRAAERVLVLEPGRPEARIWLALAREQDGDERGAVAAYKDILSGAPAGASWRQAVEERVEMLTRRLAGESPPAAGTAADGGAESAPVAGAISVDDAARIAAMSPAERTGMITRMVDGLAGRLKQNGKDLEGWLKLVRAYKVLGRDGDALGALGEARRNFDGDRKSLDEIDEVAKDLGLGS